MSSSLKALGTTTTYVYDTPTPTLLERFPAPSADANRNPVGAVQTIYIRAPEFTSLCPITGQPDFAAIVIEYTPNDWCVESKSLKLYLGSFRMCGEFHESCVNRICNDLASLLTPKKMMVRGEFTPRGGIPFWPTCWYTEPKEI